ncbi:glucokinase [Burkholderia cepacia]|nr:glucokinase [Burkholderia cepacia]
MPRGRGTPFDSDTAYADGPRLLADIGGTNARFGIEVAPGDIRQVRVYPCEHFTSIEDVIARFLADVGPPRVRCAAIAIANPMEGDEVEMTNHHWRFSVSETRRAFGFTTLLVVNDFVALATALPNLSDSDRIQVGGGVRQENGVVGLLGAGTGLGVSGLIPAGYKWIALSSEGGHMSFAPNDEREDYLLAHARKKWSHVSYERFAAGPGIELIYRALSARNKRRTSTAGMTTARIVASMLDDSDPVATETIDCFCGILGSFAGNIAVMFDALGGIYIGGGVVPKLGAAFVNSPFRARFEAKGRFQKRLSRIQTSVITVEHMALRGVSSVLAEHLEGAWA